MLPHPWPEQREDDVLGRLLGGLGGGLGAGAGAGLAADTLPPPPPRAPPLIPPRPPPFLLLAAEIVSQQLGRVVADLHTTILTLNMSLNISCVVLTRVKKLVAPEERSSSAMLVSSSFAAEIGSLTNHWRALCLRLHQ